MITKRIFLITRSKLLQRGREQKKRRKSDTKKNGEKWLELKPIMMLYLSSRHFWDDLKSIARGALTVQQDPREETGPCDL